MRFLNQETNLEIVEKRGQVKILNQDNEIIYESPNENDSRLFVFGCLHSQKHKQQIDTISQFGLKTLVELQGEF